MKSVAAMFLVVLFFGSVYSETKEVTTVAKPTLLFFMNPNGRPCQIQDQIITGMGKNLSGKADLSYVRTTEMETAREKFMKYGIRGLPTLILVDSKGAVIHRFTPGIQNAETISAQLGK